MLRDLFSAKGQIKRLEKKIARKKALWVEIKKTLEGQYEQDIAELEIRLEYLKKGL